MNSFFLGLQDNTICLKTYAFRNFYSQVLGNKFPMKQENYQKDNGYYFYISLYISSLLHYILIVK